MPTSSDKVLNIGLIGYKNLVVSRCEASTYSSSCCVQESDPTRIRELIYVRVGHELSRERVFDFEHSSITLSRCYNISIHFCRVHCIAGLLMLAEICYGQSRQMTINIIFSPYPIKTPYPVMVKNQIILLHVPRVSQPVTISTITIPSTIP